MFVFHYGSSANPFCWKSSFLPLRRGGPSVTHGSRELVTKAPPPPPRLRSKVTGSRWPGLPAGWSAAWGLEASEKHSDENIHEAHSRPPLAACHKLRDAKAAQTLNAHRLIALNATGVKGFGSLLRRNMLLRWETWNGSGCQKLSC